MKEYWHEKNKQEQKEILESGITFGEFKDRFTQPDWCRYPGALDTMWGCWALRSSTIDITKDYCSGCEFFDIKRTQDKESSLKS